MAESEAPNVIATSGEAPGMSVEASASVACVPDATDKSPVVQEVFILFKSYLEYKLGQKEKQMDSKALTETKIAHMKFKGNQKQLEHNAQLDGVLDKIKSEITPDNETVVQLVDEGKEIIRKRQKLFQMADKSVDGWKVVDEYLSDELASDSADEKRLKRARDVASRKRKQNLQEKSYAAKRVKSDLPRTEKRFFHGVQENNRINSD
jgi:hypothetical protein